MHVAHIVHVELDDVLHYVVHKQLDFHFDQHVHFDFDQHLDHVVNHYDNDNSPSGSNNTYMDGRIDREHQLVR